MDLNKVEGTEYPSIYWYGYIAAMEDTRNWASAIQ